MTKCNRYGGVVLTSFLISCSDPPPPDDPPVTCPKGLVAFEKACIPKFDACKDDEAPRLGGGCKRVGVKECTGGLEGPPAWTCKPIGPPATCISGWQKVTGGWCEPLLPASPCPDGTMAVMGKSTCVPMGDCGAGTWGKIKTAQNTVFVDGSYAGGGSDGSQAKPYTYISAALASGGHVAVAAGTYIGNLTVLSPGTTLEGRCAKLVTIKGPSATFPAVNVAAASVTVRGVTVTGIIGVGVGVSGSGAIIEDVVAQGCGEAGFTVAGGSVIIRDSLVKNSVRAGIDVNDKFKAPTPPVATVERVEVRGIKGAGDGKILGFGAVVVDGTSASFKDCIFTGTAGHGMMVNGSSVTLDRTVLSATSEDKLHAKPTGFGFIVQDDKISGDPGTATLRDCVVKDNHNTGVVALGSSTLDVSRSVVAGTLPSVLTGHHGEGIQVSTLDAGVRRARLTLRDSLVANNHMVGVHLVGADGTIERTVVRDTRPLTARFKGHDTGYGIQVERNPAVKGSSSKLLLRDSVIAGNTSYGVEIYASQVTAERVVVRDTRQGDTGAGGVPVGIGISVRTGPSWPRSTLSVLDSLVTGNRVMGLMSMGTDAKIERSIVRRTSGDSSGRHGVGISLIGLGGDKVPANVSITDSVVADNRFAGIWVASTRATIRGSAVRDTDVESTSGQYGFGVRASRAPGSSLTSAVDMADSVVSDNRCHGVSVHWGASATVSRSVVSDTRPDGKGYGDGMLAESSSATLEVKSSLVDRSARAGLAFIGAGGKVTGTTVRNGGFPVALDQGSAPTLADDNVFTGNTDDGVVRGTGLVASKPPDVVPPAQTPQK